MSQSTEITQQDSEFVDALWQIAQQATPMLGVALEVGGHAEWLGGEVKAGSKIAFYLPGLIEVSLIDGSVGLSGGVELPNWFPVSAHGSLCASLGGAMVAAIDLDADSGLQFFPRAKLAVPSFVVGGRPIPFLEAECTGLSLLFDVPKFSKMSIYFSVGFGIHLPFIPDLGKFLVQLSPKLKAKGDLQGILRFDVPTQEVMKLLD